MHSIIQEMAWEIVRKESDDDLGKQSRLLDPDDIYHILKNNKGSEAIKSLATDLSIIKELQLNPNVFAKMNKLQYLDIYSKGYSCDFVQSRGGCRVRELWQEDNKDLVNLKYLKLGSSSYLVELPDLSSAANLEVIDLRLCTALISLHPSVFTLNKLEKLDMGGCLSLRSLKSNIHLSSLRYLYLGGCTSLKEFSLTSKEMVKLNLELTGIKQLPSSIGLQIKLEKLLLGNSHIENFPKSVKLLTSLRHLGLQDCRKLQSLPELPSSLIALDASGCLSLENVTFPSTAIQMLKEKKTRVAFWNCLKLNEHSLKAMELNAQINMMKFAHQHISMSRSHPYDAKGTYVYPGSNVPKWLVYRTTHDYMTIDLSFANHSSQLGFIFCFIVPPVPSQGFILRFNISVDGDDSQLYLDRPSHEIKSDHVYLVYDRGFSRYLNGRIKDQPKFKIKITAESRTLTSESKYSNFIMECC
ncbi:hypothetical protein P8452_68803 [Trifolium repens]|nr:hypothetical protein P8452_68803 [Trifolium repens]